MREQLIQYVELLFAGAGGCEDMKQEILQNTLDRYDDLIAEGKVPQAAYRLAISGIGDINEILGTERQNIPAVSHPVAKKEVTENDTHTKKLLRAIAVGLYILCPLPLILLSELGMSTLGLCGTLAIVAVATVMIILGGKKDGDDDDDEEEEEGPLTPSQELRKAIQSVINTIGLVLYFVISFATKAWYITWLIFPIMGAVWGLTKAILDLKEATKNES